MRKYSPGATAWIVENNAAVCQIQIKSYSGGFYIVVKAGTRAAIRLRENRIYATEEEARATLPQPRSPYG